MVNHSIQLHLHTSRQLKFYYKSCHQIHYLNQILDLLVILLLNLHHLSLFDHQYTKFQNINYIEKRIYYTKKRIFSSLQNTMTQGNYWGNHTQIYNIIHFHHHLISLGHHHYHRFHCHHHHHLVLHQDCSFHHTRLHHKKNNQIHQFDISLGELYRVNRTRNIRNYQDNHIILYNI